MGGVVAVAGIAAFIEAHSQQPVAATPASGWIRPDASPVPASGLSPTAYDLLRIGAWALLILGALTVVLGLIRYYSDTRS